MKFTIVALLQILLVFIFPPQKRNFDKEGISKKEVTIAQYVRFCDETGREKPDNVAWGRDDRTMINIDWKDATAFCKWLSEK